MKQNSSAKIKQAKDAVRALGNAHSRSPTAESRDKLLVAHARYRELVRTSEVDRLDRRRSARLRRAIDSIAATTLYLLGIRR